MHTRDGSKSTLWFQLSVVDFILVASVSAIFVRLSLNGWNVGSGFSITLYGFPIPFLTDHSEFGYSIDGFTLLVDLVSWIVACATPIIAVRKIRAYICATREANSG